ncbi:MAG TPA: YbhB/YbcL family Raf kinase inhibitor-like protein [Candidatus Acidoferrales bacterium]|jgi:hypothetical protein|nr:YbhB/YbcL family Raf kinase inhibitor-like protein [Candidatus Acidoferrales bacterium]
MRLVSSGFQDGKSIPKKFTCEGENISPEFHWENAPKVAKSFVLVLHDPDAPMKDGFTHWLLYDIPASVSEIHENVPKGHERIAGLGIQGKNDSGNLGYTGPCPPSGSHRYFARLYALRAELGLSPGAVLQEVRSAIGPYVIEQTEIMGTYAKARAQTP